LCLCIIGYTGDPSTRCDLIEIGKCPRLWHFIFLCRSL
jgi:hypothetical protein